MLHRSDLLSLNGRKVALKEFTESWYPSEVYGSRPSATSPPPEFAPGCPELLRWWWGLVQTRPVLRGSQNHFVEPELVDNDAFLIYGDPPRPEADAPRLWAFWAENQGVITLACEESGDDPAVWAESDFAPTYTMCHVREREPLSTQLLRYALLEAMYGAAVGGQWGSLERAQFDEIARCCELKRLPLESTGHPLDRMEFYAGPTTIAVRDLDPETDTVRAMFGAQQHDAFEQAESMVDDPDEFGFI